MSPLVDTHCHVGHLELGPAEALAAAREAGVQTVVDIAMGTREARTAAERAASTRGVYACVGFHPNELAEFEDAPDDSISALRELAAQPRVVGIGETGLDLYRDRSAPELQERAFRAQIDLARELDLALVIHCRDAHGPLIEVLDDADAPERVVMHCFSGDVAFARICAERGYFCSFAGNITYKKSGELREVARSLPVELLLVETDAPFLAPEGHRGKPNSPALLPITVEVLAETRSMPFSHLVQTLSDNSTRAFGMGT